MRSANSRTRVLALFLALWAPGAFTQGAVRLLVQSSPLAGFRYHSAAEVWEDLHVGDRLELAREADNRFDRNAISVSWRGRKLGYVPRRQNGALAWGMDRGERLSARISRLSTHPNPARRIEFEVYIE
ncbi:MAG TPA: HIRAN domain-containing protein [Burkholderiales bacterium]